MIRRDSLFTIYTIYYTFRWGPDKGKRYRVRCYRCNQILFYINVFLHGSEIQTAFCCIHCRSNETTVGNIGNYKTLDYAALSTIKGKELIPEPPVLSYEI